MLEVIVKTTTKTEVTHHHSVTVSYADLLKALNLDQLEGVQVLLPGERYQGERNLMEPEDEIVFSWVEHPAPIVCESVAQGPVEDQ